MTLRLACLALMIAALPVEIDLPASRDSTSASTSACTSSGQTRVEVAGGGGQFAIIRRGCEGQVIDIAHEQIRSGALVVEHQFPDDIVLGVRAGRVRSTAHSSPGSSELQWAGIVPPAPGDSPYANPFAAWESPRFGIGAGWLTADHPFLFGNENALDVRVTGHVRFGEPGHRLSVRWMEDVPLESEGHLSVDLGFVPRHDVDAGVFLGLAGPYDGALVGLHGRLWLTPGAALQLKAGLSEHQQYHVSGGFSARFPAHR